MPDPTSPNIDRQAIWRRLMERAAANSSIEPLPHEPAGYEFNADAINALPQEAQTELALQLAKVVLDKTPKPKVRKIAPPVTFNREQVRRALHRLAITGRSMSRQGASFAFPMREGSLAHILRNDAQGITPGGFGVLAGDTRLQCDRCTINGSERESFHAVRHRTWCHACYTFETRTCSACAAVEPWEEMRYLDGIAPLCQECFEERATTCPTCRRVCARGTVTNSTCPACVRDNSLKSYSFKPVPTFYLPGTRTQRVTAGTVFMGVELETEVPRNLQQTDVAYEVTQVAPEFLYAKHDGSLDRGVEYVSHPFTADWLVAEGAEVWKACLKKMRDLKLKSFDTDTCGMHVHVTKAPLLHGTLGKLLRFSHHNAAEILKISRRKEEHLLRWANPRGIEPRFFADLDGNGRLVAPSKYTAINVTQHTVEFRIFKGTLGESGFFANLEAVLALLNFCTTVAEVTPTRGTAAEFETFVRQTPDKYRNLVNTILNPTVKAQANPLREILPARGPQLRQDFTQPLVLGRDTTEQPFTLRTP